VTIPYTKFDPVEMEVFRDGRIFGCDHLMISTNGFGTKGVCVVCGALIRAREKGESSSLHSQEPK
jgi:hypothetical protein